MRKSSKLLYSLALVSVAAICLSWPSAWATTSLCNDGLTKRAKLITSAQGDKSFLLKYKFNGEDKTINVTVQPEWEMKIMLPTGKGPAAQKKIVRDLLDESQVAHFMRDNQREWGTSPNRYDRDTVWISSVFSFAAPADFTFFHDGYQVDPSSQYPISSRQSGRKDAFCQN